MMSMDSQNVVSVPQYIIYGLSGVLLVSIAVILCLTGYTVRARKASQKRKEMEAKKAQENVYDVYDTYDNFYDDTGAEGTPVYDDLKIYDDTLADNEKHVYEGADDLVYESAPGDGGKSSYLEITDSIYYEMKM